MTLFEQLPRVTGGFVRVNAIKDGRRHYSRWNAFLDRWLTLSDAQDNRESAYAMRQLAQFDKFVDAATAVQPRGERERKERA